MEVVGKGGFECGFECVVDGLVNAIEVVWGKMVYGFPDGICRAVGCLGKGGRPRECCGVVGRGCRWGDVFTGGRS